MTRLENDERSPVRVRRGEGAAKLREDGVTFDEAATVFVDPLGLESVDVQHSEDEDRFVLLGRSYRDRLIVVVFSERREKIRIISARKATRRESREYVEGEGH